MKGFLLLVAVITTFALIGRFSPEPASRANTTRTTPRIDYNVIRGCKNEIRDMLRAPSTARFHDGPVYLSDSGTRFIVDVDSQNGFGAMIRTQWQCQHYKADNNYVVMQLQ